MMLQSAPELISRNVGRVRSHCFLNALLKLEDHVEIGDPW
jgi:hypothetical protein